MAFIFDYRPAEFPLVELVWRTQSDQREQFISVAESRWEMIITRQQGNTTLTIRGPETQASLAPIPQDAEFLGITFRVGSYLPSLPVKHLLNGGLHLPSVNHRSFALQGQTWELPSFENADVFINRLLKSNMLMYDPVVEAVLQNRMPDLSLRSIQRRFLQVTGLTPTAIYQIQRARQAMALLEQGVSIQDTIAQAEFYDQPHLTRILKRLMGQTPAQIMRSASAAK